MNYLHSRVVNEGGVPIGPQAGAVPVLRALVKIP
jgi:hypothetical protein